MVGTGASTSYAYEVIDEGFVVRDRLGACSRVAALDDGDLVCTYVLRSGAGRPDYTPHQARSTDGGRTWTAEGPVWPALEGSTSISVALSRTVGGDLLLYGTLTPVDDGDATWWDGERQALKQNQLVWARSRNGGRTWPEPRVIAMPIPGAAEAPGPITEIARRPGRAGRLVACYAPYHTFDATVAVDRSQIVLVKSDDNGRTWSHTSMLRFDDPDAGGAEAWVVELADGRLVGTSWSMSLRTGEDTPIPYALSHDSGDTWTPTRSTGIAGQATTLARLPDGRVLLGYNQRAEADPGVWLAVARPTEASFGVERIGPAWQADRATHGAAGGDAGHDAWTDFAFGEPSLTLLPDGDVLVTLWCDQPSGTGIRWVRLLGASVLGG